MVKMGRALSTLSYVSRDWMNFSRNSLTGSIILKGGLDSHRMVGQGLVNTQRLM